APDRSAAPSGKPLPADPEVATGQGGIPTVSLVVIEPLQPLVSLQAQLDPRPAAGAWNRAISET
ncbi:MAG: hypothetical protein ACRD22_15810, partial [Terriglobia bacterium]